MRYLPGAGCAVSDLRFAPTDVPNQTREIKDGCPNTGTYIVDGANGHRARLRSPHCRKERSDHVTHKDEVSGLATITKDIDRLLV